MAVNIPSQGTDPTNVVDPGQVNVEAQAYPRPHDRHQALPLQLQALLDASLYAPNPPPPRHQAGHVPSFFKTESQAALPPSFSQGVPTPAQPTYGAGAFAPTGPIAEFTVTPVGSFQTNYTPGDRVSYVISSVVTTGTTPNRVYQLIFANTVNLFSLGLDLTGRNLYLITQGAVDHPANPTDIPVRLINYYSTWNVFINESETQPDGSVDTLVSVPAPGQTVQVDRVRQNDEVNFNRNGGPTVNVVVGNVPLNPVTGFSNALPAINVIANSGVVRPTITSGRRVPLVAYANLPQGVIEVENQQPPGNGLPVNVFI